MLLTVKNTINAINAIRLCVTVHTQAGKQQKMKDLLLHDK